MEDSSDLARRHKGRASESNKDLLIQVMVLPTMSEPLGPCRGEKCPQGQKQGQRRTQKHSSADLLMTVMVSPTISDPLGPCRKDT
jgi:hypothetical protein